MSFPRFERTLASGGTTLLAVFVLQSTIVHAQTVTLDEIVVDTAHNGNATQTPATLTTSPKGQVQTIVGADRSSNTRAFSVTDLLLDSPGVSVKQGNGPRDIGISIRGSNARNGFGIRNIVIFDDGFPVTQPDGLSRSDLIDPHAYGSVDVIRGPSSALYGNYATGGAIDFRTIRGGAIDGVEVGADAGSYGYFNTYLRYGEKSGNAETSVFASEVLGSSRTSHSRFNTQTANALLRYDVTPSDHLTFKIIQNHLQADLSNRLSLAQFYRNPYQRGCAVAAMSAPGCQNIALLTNGYSGARVPVSADQAGFGRNDNRAILGVRYEHDFGQDATWRSQVTVDDRNINQPTGVTSAIGDYLSVNAISDVVGRGSLLGLDATHYAAVFVNTLSSTGYTYNVAPGGNATLGGISQIVPSTTTNYGGRLREELRLSDKWLFVTGVGVEETDITGRSTGVAYSAPGTIKVPISQVSANRQFLNTAPEVSLVFNPIRDWTVTGRVATGYGTPTASNLFVTSTGAAGNNTTLKPQTNLGYDLAVAYQPGPNLTATVDGFYEFFHNELVNQSPGPGLALYTYNAPRSEHRGVEAALKWAFAHDWLLTAAYTYDNQIYTDYTEQLSSTLVTSRFNRDGNRIPGVPLHELLVRLGYDVSSGSFKGWGAYAEYVKQSDFYVDNANLVSVPGYDLLNLNLHYTREFDQAGIKSISAYVECRNATNQTYVASANNVANTINAKGQQNNAASVAMTAGSIYAGIPASFYGGVRVKF